MLPREPRTQPGHAGVKALSLCLVIFGLLSFGGVVQLFPMWLEAARRHQYGNESFVWLEIVTMIAALSAGYGLWHRRRWARIPTLVLLFALLTTVFLIVAFGMGGITGINAWFMLTITLLPMFFLSAWLVWYVWKQT